MSELCNKRDRDCLPQLAHVELTGMPQERAQDAIWRDDEPFKRGAACDEKKTHTREELDEA